MSDPVHKIDIDRWINLSKADSKTYAQRQVTQIILYAIAIEPYLSNSLHLKGGVLMGIVYESPRTTKDIDFSMIVPDDGQNHNIGATIKSHVNPVLKRAAAKLGYADTILRVQSIEEWPRDNFWDGRFPALRMKVGYAKRGSHQEKMLLNGKASNTVGIDISFKEVISNIQILEIAEGQSLRAYSLIDLIAEKYRAQFQSIDRNRYRKEDVYDLHFLIKNFGLDDKAKIMILETLIKKCESRDISPTSDLIDNAEIKRRSSSEWNMMKLEFEEVPDFSSCFERVVNFYHQLPWRK